MGRRKKIIAGNEVSELVQWNLGGYAQKVLLEGKRKGLPVVLCLHGGPGTPVPFNAGCRGLFPEFTDHFIMAYWDQLGCGINNRPMEDIFSLDLMVDMTRDLIFSLREKFPENPIYLLAVSWGTVLSALGMEKVGEALSGVVASGQVVHDLTFNEITRAALQKTNLPPKKIQSLLSLEPETATAGELQKLMAVLRSKTDGFRNPKDQAPVGPVIWGMLTSPDYSLRDFMAVVQNGYTGLEAPIRQLTRLDLRETLRGTKIPYWMLCGETDLVTPGAYARKLSETAGNPRLFFREIPDSGHFFGPRGMDRLLETLQNLAASQQQQLS